MGCGGGSGGLVPEMWMVLCFLVGVFNGVGRGRIGAVRRWFSGRKWREKSEKKEERKRVAPLLVRVRLSERPGEEAMATGGLMVFGYGVLQPIMVGNNGRERVGEGCGGFCEEVVHRKR
ncbi:hypothetical protein HAX54_039522 [Datura stramonium]|uniref:Uncharacterized protein n=1 Tax=Datura stramonium TaxID=4076 RepID=A0ABS8VPA7_DATST|nr:hypothetical protein [Datura stramonium]